MQERTLPRCLLRGGLLLVVIVLLGSGSQARAQACTSELPKANEAYTFGRFDETIKLLNECLKKQGVVRIEQQQSHRLLALSYIGKDEPSQARASVRNLVSQAPDYQPDPEQDPPPFVQMVQEVQRELEQAAAASKAKTLTPAPELAEQPEEKGEQDTIREDLAARAEAFSQAGNDREALPLFREAAEQGHPGAQYRLGLLYRQGDVLEHDDQKAMTWFGKAAEQGHAEAQFYVGWLHWKGEGVEQNEEEAIKWFRKAAGQEHQRARRVLNRMTGKS